MKFSHLTRVYLNESLQEEQSISLLGADLHYINSVMRLKVGHSLRVFNESNGEFLAIIEKVSRSCLVIKITEFLRAPLKEKNLILAMCIIKPDRFSEAVKAAVQLGVTKIIPVISERTQLKTIPHERIEKIILQSTQQSERFKPAELTTEIELQKILGHDELRQIIFACESADEDALIKNIEKWHDQVAVLVGPEGGFTDEEITMLQHSSRVTTVSLGNSVLRAETASIASLACTQMMRNN
ncbi:MAG: hypothetical protein DGJ47_000288 [Rickettsiaceae bacterium]